MMIDRAAGARGVSVSVFVCPHPSFPSSVPPLALSLSISLFLTSLLTDAVGLQRAELESWLAVAGVASLHGNTFPTAAYGGGGGTLVNTYGKATEMCTVISQRADQNICDPGLHNITDTVKKK